jgi:hypothetical protein
VTALGQDPCATGNLSDSILSSYTKLLIEGNNIKNKDLIRSDTVKGYLKQVNTLYSKRGLPIPITNFQTSTHSAAILYRNLKAEEDIAAQRSPLLPQMVAEILHAGKKADFFSLEALMLDVVVISREIGPRAAEIAQKVQSRPDYHHYPSGKKVIKAMCEDWRQAYDDRNRIIKNPISCPSKVHKMKITWMIQKNRRNKEPLTYIKGETGSDFCVPSSITRMIKRARGLGQPSNLPLCVFRGRGGRLAYLTASAITKYLRKIAKKVHPNISKMDLDKISAHSLRVWAACLLHEAGQSGDYIKKRLRWLSECYRVYLRDSDVLGQTHNETLEPYSKLIAQIALSPENTPDNVEYTVPEDSDMGDYNDIE